MRLALITIAIFSLTSTAHAFKTILSCDEKISGRTFELSQGAAGLDFIVKEHGTLLPTATTGLSCSFSNLNGEVFSCTQLGSHKEFFLVHGAAGFDFYASEKGTISSEINYTGLANCTLNY